MKKIKSKYELVDDTEELKTNDELQKDIEEDTLKFFNQMDKPFFKYFGEACPEFEPDCVQCKVNLLYRDFKLKLWEKFVRK